MTSFLRHAARSIGLTAADKRAAESLLGHGDRLTRAVSTQHTLALQSVVAALTVVAAALAVLLHLASAALVLGVCAAVALAFAVAWAVAHRRAHERAQDLIAAGRDGVDLSVVAHERRRLASRRRRERLARSLEAFHRDALRWYETPASLRPLHGVVQLRYLGKELVAMTKALRRDRVHVQGVALAERLLSDGYASPLYGNEVGPLRDELNRIRYLLESDSAGELDPNRKAA